MRFAILAVCVVFLAACSQPKIDTSSEDAFVASLKQVADSLDGDERKEFEAATGEMASAMLMAKTFGMSKTAMQSVAPANGMTGSEFVAFIHAQREAAKAKAEEKAKEEAEKDRQELATLEAKEATIRAALDKIHASDFGVVKEKYDASLVVTIRNGGDTAIKSIVLRYALRTDGRAVAWEEGDAYFQPTGGIEPGEQVSVKGMVSGRPYGAGSLLKASNEHPDATFTISVKEATDANNAPIGGALDRNERMRLEQLRQKLAAATPGEAGGGK